jgi:hypothetical protein
MELPIGNLSEHLDDGERAPFSRALYLDINDAFGGTKPLWRMSDALRVITALCDGGAAVAQGQIFVLSGSGLHPSPPSMSDGPEVKLFTPDAWWCRRKEDESWMDYVDRAARTAQANIRRARESAQDNADIEVYADLAWSTRDELALFRLPKYLRENLRSKLTRCQPLPDSWPDDGTRVRFSGDVAAGSYYGKPADSLDGIPRSARYLIVSGRAKNIDCLADFRSLEVLEMYGGDDSALAAVAALGKLRWAMLCDLHIENLTALSGLVHLSYLRLTTRRKSPSLAVLARLPKLKVLELGGRTVDKLSEIGRLRRLRGLRIVGKDNPPKVLTLAPLEKLANLRYLDLSNLRVEDGSLHPVTQLLSLRQLDTDNQFSTEEYAAVARSLPKLTNDLRSPFVPASMKGMYGDWMQFCGKCDQPTRLLTRGRPVKWLCERCDEDRIRRHVANWELLLAGVGVTRGRKR